MGTDIHILIEFYDEQKKCWVLMKLNPETKIYEIAEVENIVRKDEDFDERVSDHYENLPDEHVLRNYYLFVYLADIRTDDEPINPKNLPKGLPLDVSQEGLIAADYDYEYKNFLNGHTHTWFSTEDILKINWDKIIISVENQDVAVLRDSKSVRQLMKITRLAYNQCPKSRILMFFDN